MIQLVIILAIVFIVLTVLIFIMRKIKGVVISLLLALISLVGIVVYVLVVPESDLSVWVTENIAGSIAFDSEDVVDSGKPIWETKYDILSTDKTVDEAQQPINFVYDSNILDTLQNTNISELSDSFNSFILDRVCAIAASKLSEANKEYRIEFKDSYFVISIEESFVYAQLIKI